MIRDKKSIFLIGPMGAGKTTIGRFLANELNLEFVDSDKEIEKRTGVDISMIFDYEGEDGFRRREAEVLAQLTQQANIVLATGGGSILWPENRERLRRYGFVVYLHCPVDKQLERTSKDSQRPLLQTGNPRDTLTRIFGEREPIYRELADCVVDTTQDVTRKTIQHILRAYRDFTFQHDSI